MNKHQFCPELPFQVIILDSGEQVFVSTCDFEKVIKYHWRLGTKKYVIAGHGSEFRIHYVVLDLERNPCIEVHHIDGNPLNNIRENLQPLSLSDHRVTRPKQSNNKVGYKGVSWKTSNSKYCAQIKHNGRVIHIGLYYDPIEAAKAYDAKAKELFGDIAFLNFPYGSP